MTKNIFLEEILSDFGARVLFIRMVFNLVNEEFFPDEMDEINKSVN